MRDALRGQARAGERTRLQSALGVSPLHPDAAVAYSTALGQVAVSRELADLGPGWTVINAVAPGVDHLVIGPAGIFAITTKRLDGMRVTVDGMSLSVGGRPTDFQRAARTNAKLAAQMLSRSLLMIVHVRPILVVVDAQSLGRGGNSPAVSVLTPYEAVHSLRDLPKVLSPADVTELVMAASDWRTWSTTVLEPGNTHVEARFVELHDRVKRAAARQRLAYGVAALALAGALVALMSIALEALFVGF
jgi:hypothetical protein